MRTPPIPFVESFADRLVGTVAPHMCMLCGAEGAVMCDSCLLSAGEPPAPRCAGCKTLHDGYRTCGGCRSWLNIYAVYVATEYDGVYERLLHEYKFALKRQAADQIASIMSEVALDLPRDVTVAVPIPTAPSRIRQRGFDHIKILAKTYARYLNKRRDTPIAIRETLARRSNTRQLGASRARRITQMGREFFVKDSVHVAGKTVLLIDDMTTTGASLAAAAQVLKDAGARRVYAVVFAQKV